MGEVFVITSGKGGVGKTTSTANIGAGLAAADKKTILIDTDIGLRNLDVIMGLENRIVYHLVDIIEGGCRIKQALIRDKRYPNLFLLPSAQTRDKTSVSPEQMKKLIEQLRDDFDYILIDCMPSLGMITINALVAADRVLIPVEAAYLPVKGLQQLIKTIGRVHRKLNPELSIMGILFTKVDRRTNFAKDIAAQIREVYGNKIHIFANCIPMSVRAAETTAEGKSIYLHDPKGIVAEGYHYLTGEVLDDEE